MKAQFRLKVVALGLAMLTFFAATLGAQDYAYTSNNGAITITRYTGPYTGAPIVVIPGEINGLPVTTIGDGAFYMRVSLTSVVIPNSVTNIGERAFHACDGLTSVVIPNSVTSIGNLAFLNCSSLRNVTIPNSVTSIGEEAFEGCDGLTDITVDTLNPVYSSVDGVLFNNSQTTLIKYPGGKPRAIIGNYTVPNSVTSIGERAFAASIRLTSVVIPNSVTNIGEAAFSSCRRLTSVMIPNSVTTIGNGVFQLCYSLTNVTIPRSVTSIGNLAFLNCSSIRNVTIPTSVTNIGEGTFRRCDGLTDITVEALNATYSSVDGVLFDKAQTTLIQYPGAKPGNYTIPNGVTSIGEWAFSYCPSLTGVTIGNSVNSIGNYAFAECTSLTSVTMGNSVTSIGDFAIAWCASLTNLTIGNSVTSIGDNAIAWCSSLANVTIPNSVTSIGEWAFALCTGLTNVTIGNSVTSIGEGAFSSCRGLTSVVIPSSVTSIGKWAFDSWSLTGVYFEGNAPNEGSDSDFGQSPNVTVYYLPGTSGWGTTFGGHPTAQWVLPYPEILTTAPSFGVQTNNLGFIISWATNVPVVVEASTTLANPIWASVSTNSLTEGWSHFRDVGWTNHPSRFYRIRGLRSSPF